MSEADDEHFDWAVITANDSDLDWSDTGARLLHWREEADQQDELVDCFEGEPAPIVIDGDDRLVSTIITAYRRWQTPGTPEGRFCPIHTDAFATIASDVGAPERQPGLPARLADRAAGERWSMTTRESIRVTPSTEPASQYGFTFGAGLWFALFEMQYRTGTRSTGWGRALGEWAKELLSSDGESRFQPETGRVSIDYEPWGETLGYALISGLETTWFGESFGGDSLQWRAGESGRTFVREATTSRAMPSFFREGTGESFDRIHLDWTGGYVLDGELYDPDVPYVLQLAPGPEITFVR